MYCKNCGKEIKDSATFCPYCGTNVKDTTSEGETRPLTEEKPVYSNPNPIPPKKNFKNIIIVGIICVALVICVGAVFVKYFKSNDGEQTTENEDINTGYDSSDNNSTNNEVILNDNYTVDDIVSLFENGEDAYVYFYNDCQDYYWCEWCEVTSKAVNEVSEKANIQVYKVKTRDDNGNYTYSDSSKSALYPYLGSVIMEDNTLWVPTFIHIRDGNVVGYYQVTCDLQSSACPTVLSDSEYQHLIDAYMNVINS